MSQENESKLWETIKLLESENAIYKNRINEDQMIISELENSINAKADLYWNLNEEVEKIQETIEDRNASTETQI